MWCSWVSSSSGSLWPTWRISTLVIACPPAPAERAGAWPLGPRGVADPGYRPQSSELPLVVGERGHRLIAVQRQDALADPLDVEQRSDAEARPVGGDPADEGDRRPPEDAEPDVVDHLARADLEHTDARRAVGRVGHRVGGEWPEGDRADVADLLALGPELLHHVLHEL